jgi:NAD-dependent deacetylase
MSDLNERHKPPNMEPMVVLTGAGISAESGVPTFRGAGGLWEDYRAEELATPRAFAQDPELVWRFYAWRRDLVDRCTPNLAHHTLAAIESALEDFLIITQNVDGLHLAAGSKNVLELHGSLWRSRCTHCLKTWTDRRSHLSDSIPACPNCGAMARPDVVWFGEQLDGEILERAFAAASQAAIMLVIGTSSLVQPAAMLPQVAKQAGAYLVEINLEKTSLTPISDRFLQGSATEMLARWWEENAPAQLGRSLHME